jgi:predicted secreted protein
MKKIILTAMLLTAFALPATAQDNVVELPDGHTALNISATERVEVEQDLLIASLRIQYEAETSKEVQDYINKKMKAAMDEIKDIPSLKVETGSYYVHPDYRYTRRDNDGNQERVLDKWRGSQTVTIKSQASEDVLKVAGKLQDMDFMMNGLNYQLSPQKHEEVRDNLMEATIKKLNERAKRVGRALGKNNVDIVEINVDAHGGFQPQPVYARAAKMEMLMSADAASMAEPVAESGETTVSMTINARAIIKP